MSEDILYKHIKKWMEPGEPQWSAFLTGCQRKLNKDEIYLNEGTVCMKLGLIINGCVRMFCSGGKVECSSSVCVGLVKSNNSNDW